LSAAFWELADEPENKKIARAIIARRAVQPITQTSQLVDLIFDAKGIIQKTWRQERRTSQAAAALLHPAALTFQALRILVNDELGCLKELLRIAPYCLRPGGRIGIISFHSGEDRLVKKAFREGVRSGIYSAIWRTADDPITPQFKEINANPRSASAKFRWAVLKSS
jgi:16S rRNA (cytosine1402-N4)-methyltransferase